MVDTSKYHLMIEHLEKVKSVISPSDFRFYNISHMPLVIKKTIFFSDECKVCKENIKKLEKLILSLPHSLTNNIEERKRFESEKNSVESHLKSLHKQRFPGYYAATGSLLGIILGIIPPVVYSIIVDTQIFNRLLLVGFAMGLIIGRVLGVLTDRKIYVKNSQL